MPLLACFDRITCRSYRQRCGMLGNAVVPQTALLALISLSQNVSFPPLIKLQTNVPRIVTDGQLTFRRTTSDTPLASLNLWFPVKLSERSLRNVVTQLVHDTRNQDLLNKLEVAHKGKHYSIVANPEYIEWLCGFPKGWTCV